MVYVMSAQIICLRSECSIPNTYHLDSNFNLFLGPRVSKQRDYVISYAHKIRDSVEAKIKLIKFYLPGPDSMSPSVQRASLEVKIAWFLYAPNKPQQPCVDRFFGKRLKEKKENRKNSKSLA